MFKILELQENKCNLPGMEVPLIITKPILNTDIEYHLMLLYKKLGMTMNENNVLKNNSKHIKNIKFIKYFICGENFNNIVKLIIFILLEYLK